MQFEAETIDSNTCTHLNYGFAKLVDNKIQLADTYLDPENNNDGAQGMYKRFNNLRNENPHLTTLISIGGWNEGSVKYSKMAMNKSTRKIFIDSVVEFLQKHNFDGLDLDW